MLSTCRYFFLSEKSVWGLWSPGSYGGLYRYPINMLKLLGSTKPNHIFTQTCQNLILLITVDLFHLCNITFSESACTPAHIIRAYLLVFHIWTTSGSVIFLLSAWASRKSKKYLMATGALLLGKLQMLLKSFSTTEWIATWKVRKWIVPLLHKKRGGFLVSESWACRKATTHRNYNMLVVNI